jgi:hypothetical protein
MKLSLGLAVAAVSLTAVAAFAAVESGLKPGAMPSPFQVVDVTGPNKGRELCYRCQYGNAPVLTAFVNGDVAKSGKLLTELQKIVDANKSRGLRAFVTYMAGPEAKDAIQKVAADNKITIPLVFLPKGAKDEEVASYKINPKAKNTVILWKSSKVTANFVDVEADKTAEVAKAAEAMLK